MENITLSTAVFYKAGKAGVSGVVGYESGAARIARHSFVSPESGASELRLAFSGNWVGKGDRPKLAFYIGTDPDSHGNAGTDAPRTGTLTLQSDYLSYAGAAQVMLLPGVTYYVWVFPTTKTFGWVYWSQDAGDAVASLSGGALSTLAVTDGTLGQPQSLHVTRYTDYPHSIYCTLGTERVTVCENSTDADITWTPPLTLAAQLPQSRSQQAQYTVVTGDVGQTQTSATLTVPDTLTPTVSFTWRDATDSPFLLQNRSKLTLSVEASGAYGAAIRSVAVTLDGKAYTGQLLQQAGSRELAVTVTDSRGLTARADQTLTVTAYTQPHITLHGSRCDQDGTANDMGEFVHLTAAFTFTALDTGNRPVLTLAGETVYPKESGSCSTILPAPSVTSPLFEATLTDGVPATATARFQLSIGYATLDFLAGGKGIAFGTTATAPGFTCAMDTDFCGKAVTGLPRPASPTAPVTKESLLELVYPVGSIYISCNDADPSLLFGGEWERIQDRFLLAAGSVAAGATGGSDTHFHTLSDGAIALINHHDGKFWFYEKDGVSFVASGSGAATGANVNAQQSAGIPLRGGTDTASTMPPYLAVYVWKRSA